MRFYGGRWGVDTPAEECAAFGGVLAAFSSGCARSKMAHKIKTRYRSAWRVVHKAPQRGSFLPVGAAIGY